MTKYLGQYNFETYNRTRERHFAKVGKCFHTCITLIAYSLCND